jgi:DNA-directed RNA polymerase beta subunit
MYAGRFAFFTFSRERFHLLNDMAKTQEKTTALVQKTFGAYRAPRVDFPDLVGHQRDSFKWLIKDGLGELFKEFSPIGDYSGKKFELRPRRKRARTCVLTRRHSRRPSRF